MEDTPTKDTQNPQETTIKQPKTQAKTIEAIRLVQNGADYQTALQITNNKPVISQRAIYKLKDKCKKYELTNPKTVKLADSQVKRILKGEPRSYEIPVKLAGKVILDEQGKPLMTTETVIPTDSNITALLGMIYDRFEPVIHQQININTEFSPVDLSSYFNGARPEPVKMGDIEAKDV
jgi:hypothetical protein